MSGLLQVAVGCFWFARTSVDLMGPLATWRRPFLYFNLSKYTYCIQYKEKTEKTTNLYLYVFVRTGPGQVLGFLDCPDLC